MAYTMNEVDIRGLRATHFEQIQSYIGWAEEQGIYYGNKKQFDKRHAEIKEWIDDIAKQARDSDCRIDKKPPYDFGY